MTIALIVLGSLVALVLIVAGLGYLLPVAHTATVERPYAASVNHLFAAVATPSDYPRWRRGVTNVEMLQAQQGKPTFREMGSNGPMTFAFDELVPDRRIVSRIADTNLAFGGSWTYEFSPTETGSTLRITENGEVYNPVFRFMARFIFGHDRTMRQFHEDLGRRVAVADSARR
jgi:uncharacterized protein YndB with AHSA1/START domain